MLAAHSASRARDPQPVPVAQLERGWSISACLPDHTRCSWIHPQAFARSSHSRVPHHLYIAYDALKGGIINAPSLLSFSAVYLWISGRAMRGIKAIAGPSWRAIQR